MQTVLQITLQARVIHIPLRLRVPRIPLLTRAPRVPLQPRILRTPLRLRAPALAAQQHPLTRALRHLLALIRPQGMMGTGTTIVGTMTVGMMAVGTMVAGMVIMRMMMMALLGYLILLQASLQPTPQIRQGAESVPCTKSCCTRWSPVISIAPFYRTIVASRRPTFPPSHRTGKISAYVPIPSNHLPKQSANN